LARGRRQECSGNLLAAAYPVARARAGARQERGKAIVQLLFSTGKSILQYGKNKHMDYTTFAILTLSGFTACAEFGSYAFVHPILRDLPQKYHIQVERGLLLFLFPNIESHAILLWLFGEKIDPRNEKSSVAATGGCGGGRGSCRAVEIFGFAHASLQFSRLGRSLALPPMVSRLGNLTSDAIAQVGQPFRRARLLKTRRIVRSGLGAG
jgi:hypothetical protein